ncbi:unnamed protein product, partial [marine sediment metagenome]
MYDQTAREIVHAWEEGTRPQPISNGKELYSVGTAFLYRCFGARPLAAKLFNALI